MCRLLQDDRVPFGDRVEDFGKLAHRSGFRSQTRREMGEGGLPRKLSYVSLKEHNRSSGLQICQLKTSPSLTPTPRNLDKPPESWGLRTGRAEPARRQQN